MSDIKYTVNDGAVVYFTASWCQPCKRMAPIINELAEERPDVAFMVVDIEEQPEIAAEWGVTAVPTFIRTNGHDIVAKKPVIGAYPKAVLRRGLDV